MSEGDVKKQYPHRGREVLKALGQEIFGPDYEGKRGPKRTKPSQSQVGEFLRLLHQGHGRVMACFLVQMSYHVFLRHLRGDKRFAEEVREAEAIRMETCEGVLFRCVTDSSDPSVRLRAAVAYLGRRDKLKEALRARREKAAQTSVKKAE